MIRRPAIGRRIRGIIGLATAAALGVTAFGVTPSLAGWTHTEFDHGVVTPLNCASGTPFTTTAWAQEIAGQVAGTPLDSHLATVLGVTAASATPHSTATGGAGSAGLTYLGSDAWSSNLQAGALNAISLGAGVTLPISQNTGVETQFARATNTGIATGASGAVTSAAGGLVSLQSPTSATPGVGSISLASALSATVGSKLSSDVTQLANASLTVGALGSVTTLDSCNALWQGMTDAAFVVRSYVLAKLGLNFTSSLVGTTVTDVTTAVTSLGATLNLLQPNGTLVTNAAVTTALTSAIAATVSPLGVTIGGPTSVELGVAFNLAPALSALTGTITSGPVSINLSTGQISVDLAGLAGLSSLNLQPVNTKLISPATLTALTADIDSAISTLITSTLKTAILSTLNSATVTVKVLTDIKLAGIDAAALTINISGSVGQFTSPGTFGAPTISISKVDVAGAATLLALLLAPLGLSLDGLLAIVLGNLVTPLTTTLVPALATNIIAPIITTATTDVTSAITTLNTTTLAPVYTALGGVVTVIGQALEVTINAEPDVVAGSVGPPEMALAGEFFESALHIGVLDTVDGSSTLGLFLGSSAAGPNTKN